MAAVFTPWASHPAVKDTAVSRRHTGTRPKSAPTPEMTEGESRQLVRPQHSVDSAAGQISSCFSAVSVSPPRSEVANADENIHSRESLAAETVSGNVPENGSPQTDLECKNKTTAAQVSPDFRSLRPPESFPAMHVLNGCDGSAFVSHADTTTESSPSNDSDVDHGSLGAKGQTATAQITESRREGSQRGEVRQSQDHSLARIGTIDTSARKGASSRGVYGVELTTTAITTAATTATAITATEVGRIEDKRVCVYDNSSASHVYATLPSTSLEGTTAVEIFAATSTPAHIFDPDVFDKEMIAAGLAVKVRPKRQAVCQAINRGGAGMAAAQRALRGPFVMSRMGDAKARALWRPADVPLA